jgi:hypothetical protein
MAKYGVRLKIDVTKILKQHIFEGKQGKYVDATVFIDVDNKDKFDNNGMITQSWKDQQKGEGPILGNAQVFWRDDGGQQKQQKQSAPPDEYYDDDTEIPF